MALEQERLKTAGAAVEKRQERQALEIHQPSTKVEVLEGAQDPGEE
jgi:hypothetical protein